jgi:hypothetical protein
MTRPRSILLLLSSLLVASLLGAGRARHLARGPAQYQVELRYTGYSGLATSKDCDAMANLAGYDVLTGTVSGVEPSQPSDDDVEYQGRLQRTTKMDFCNARGKRSPTDDEVVWCIAGLTGTSEMDVEITVSGSPDAGAYVKAHRTSRMATSLVQGTCDPADMQQIQNDYPGADDGGGGSPNGQPITDLLSVAPNTGTLPPKFVVGGIPRLRPGSYLPDPKLSSWALTVR